MGITGNPLAAISLFEYGRRLRSGETTVLSTVRSYLDRIEQLDSYLEAYEYVATDAALEAAQAIDGMIRGGMDLGPLMGVPIAVKDLFAVENTPTHAGSRVDVRDIVGKEGSFVRTLKRQGAIILGKTKTVEFALGAVGTNTIRGTPWNPHDPHTKRITGGSSSGSAVAVAAGLCAFAIGTDTGGSVRLPAALCGVFGLKTTVGLWPTDGVFPLSPTLDSIGLITTTAADASFAYEAIMGLPAIQVPDISRLRLGKPSRSFFDDLDPDVSCCIQAAIEQLGNSGARIVDIEVPEADERQAMFPVVLPAELVSTLGRERFEKNRHLMDPVVAARAARGLTAPAAEYIQLVDRHHELIEIAKQKMADLDCWITPSATITAPPVADFEDHEQALSLAFSITRNSQPMNLFGQCGASLPIHHLGSSLPVGFQIACAPNSEQRVLAISCALEALLGVPRPVDSSAFVRP